MIIVSDLFEGEINISDDKVSSVVIESPRVYRCLVQRLYMYMNDQETSLVISEDHKPLKGSKCLELITTFVPLEINDKRFVNKISSVLADEALSPENYDSTMRMMTDIESYMNILADNLMVNVSYKSINPASLIKMCGLQIEDDSNSDIEWIYNYMSLVRELLGDRLFIFINMCSFFETEDMVAFFDTVVRHRYKVLLLESVDHHILKHTDKTVVDKDICII